MQPETDSTLYASIFSQIYENSLNLTSLFTGCIVFKRISNCCRKECSSNCLLPCHFHRQALRSCGSVSRRSRQFIKWAQFAKYICVLSLESAVVTLNWQLQVWPFNAGRPISTRPLHWALGMAPFPATQLYAAFLMVGFWMPATTTVFLPEFSPIWNPESFTPCILCCNY